VIWLKLVLGVLLLVVAARQFAGRPAADAEPTMPDWMESIDRFGAARSLGTGAALAGVNPKNFLLAVSAATAIAQTVMCLVIGVKLIGDFVTGLSA